MYKYELSAFADEASGELEKQIEAMKKNGVTMLEARNVNGKNVSLLTPEEAKNVLSLLCENGLCVFSIGSPVGKSDICDDFSKEKERFKRTLENAFIMKAKCIRLFSFYKVDTEEKKNEALYRLSEFVREAKGSGIVLCHENEKEIYGENAENCLEILEKVKGMKAVFDPANFVQCSVDTKKAWEALSPYVEYIHVKDALSDKSVVPAGYGIGNLEYICKDFLEKGGRVFSLEPHLRVFNGLEALQSDELKTKFTYETSFDAFKASADSFRNLFAEK